MKLKKKINKSICQFIFTTICLASFTNVNGQLSRGKRIGTEVNFKATQTSSGLILKRNLEQLSITFIKSDIVRIQYVPEGKLLGNQTGVLVEQKTMLPKISFADKKTFFMLSSNQLMVHVDKLTGAVSYYDANGKSLLQEDVKTPRNTQKVDIEKITFDQQTERVVKTADGDKTTAEISKKEILSHAWKATLNFKWQNTEALYGLGSHQEGYMNLRGTKQYLYQHNLKKSVPVLMSSLGYGILFDAGSTMIFEDGAKGGQVEMNAVNQIDYYFMYGPKMDKVVGCYRELTGKVQIMPQYVFGYTQSKERYTNQYEIDSVVTRFRTAKIPLDIIVQDWHYWKEGLWGHKKFDEQFYLDPKKMIDNVHLKNAHFMLSIWPFVAADEKKEMSDKGFVLGNSIYDAFSPEARKMYWKDYVQKNLFSKGVDAWWCDASEPEAADGDWNAKSNPIANDALARYKLNSTALNNLLGSLRANLFTLNHAKGIYTNQRLATEKKRVVNLTRSGSAGIQRYGTIIWNGDTKATWADFANWIPSGLNYMATGNPYWTIDAGAFFVKTGPYWFWKGDFNDGPKDPGYREFYLRTLQFAAWLPMMRSHGTDFAREPWQFGKPGEPVYDAILAQIHLRYKLLPYTYSLAAMVSDENYTMTRPLFFDFREDPKVYDIKDQFMFGPAFMACPVTTPMYYGPNAKVLEGVKKSRNIYLPKGSDWIDFWNGRNYKGGQTITADAPLEHIPVFVKAGSIVPTSAAKQYSSEKTDQPMDIRIYPGKDATFTLYEDEGDNYNYESGKFSKIKFIWNDKQRTLTIGERKGKFLPMEDRRKFAVLISQQGFNVNDNPSIASTKLVNYEGNVVSVKF